MLKEKLWIRNLITVIGMKLYLPDFQKKTKIIIGYLRFNGNIQLLETTSRNIEHSCFVMMIEPFLD